jgi:hypothetical protein
MTAFPPGRGGGGRGTTGLPAVEWELPSVALSLPRGRLWAGKGGVKRYGGRR